MNDLYALQKLVGARNIKPRKSLNLHQSWSFLVAQLIKNLPTMRETWVRSLGWEDPLEKGKATHSSILAWRIPQTAQSMGSQSRTQLNNFHFTSCIKQITNKDLVYSIGNYTQYFVIIHKGKYSVCVFVYIYIKPNHFAIHLKLLQHCKSTIL